jgi:dihydroorotate dehydrogenase
LTRTAYSLLKPLLFRLDPESAHSLIIQLMRLVGWAPGLSQVLVARYQAPSRPVQAFGLQFKNPIGLAAGYDKDGLAWRGLACLGFGHIEIGTVTPRPQPGNPRPRIFRLPEDQALVNRMGFPGRGAKFVRDHIRGPHPTGLILGVNLGKNFDTPLESAGEDYLALLEVFAPLADYLAINVSSPNTIGLRRLQARDALQSLLADLDRERQRQESQIGRHVPLLVKLSPDLSSDELEDALEVIQATGMDGVILTNTTLSREGVTSPLASQPGGLSGRPLRERSTAMVARVRYLTGGNLPVIAAGGVFTAQDVREKIDAGASLVQIYTGLVYQGPGMVQDILKSL